MGSRFFRFAVLVVLLLLAAQGGPALHLAADVCRDNAAPR